MNRRDILTGIGSGITLLAGCASSGNESQSTTTRPTTTRPTATTTTSTPTASPTLTETPDKQILTNRLDLIYKRVQKLPKYLNKRKQLLELEYKIYQMKDKYKYAENADKLNQDELDRLFTLMEKIDTEVSNLLSDYTITQSSKYTVSGSPDFERAAKYRKKKKNQLEQDIKLKDYDAISAIISEIGETRLIPNQDPWFYALKDTKTIGQIHIETGLYEATPVAKYVNKLYNQMYDISGDGDSFTLVHSGTSYFDNSNHLDYMNKLFSKIVPKSGEKIFYEGGSIGMISQHESPDHAKQAYDKILQECEVVSGTQDYGLIKNMDKIGWTSKGKTGYGLTKHIGKYSMVLSASNDEWGNPLSRVKWMREGDSGSD